MEIWVLMWMLQFEGADRYQPRMLEVEGTLATCERKADQLRIYYALNNIKYGNMYCTRKEQT